MHNGVKIFRRSILSCTCIMLQKKKKVKVHFKYQVFDRSWFANIIKTLLPRNAPPSCSWPEPLMSSQKDKGNLQKSYWKNLLSFRGFWRISIVFRKLCQSPIVHYCTNLCWWHLLFDLAYWRAIKFSNFSCMFLKVR